MERVRQAASQFVPENSIGVLRPFGNGHINDTYIMEALGEGAVRTLTLQRINHEVFKDPEQLMENITKVTSWLRKRILEEGGNPKRETLNVVYALDGKSYYISSICWRISRRPSCMKRFRTSTTRRNGSNGFARW